MTQQGQNGYHGATGIGEPTHGGNEAVFARNLGSFGQNQAADLSEKYLRYDSSSKDNALPLTVFQGRRAMVRSIRLIAQAQRAWGWVNKEELQVDMWRGNLAVDGYARQQAFEVDIGARAVNHGKDAQVIRMITPEPPSKTVGR